MELVTMFVAMCSFKLFILLGEVGVERYGLQKGRHILHNRIRLFEVGLALALGYVTSLLGGGTGIGGHVHLASIGEF
jgi:hypothetical protein